MDRSRGKSLAFGLTLAVFGLFLGSCSKDQAATPQNTGVIYGTVKDGAGKGIGDVQVAVPGREVKTNDQGYFAVENLAPTDSLAVTFKKAGFVGTSRVTKIQAGEGSYLTAVLSTERQGQALSNRNSGTVTSDRGASVTVPPNSLVSASTGEAFDGTAIASVTPFDPTTPEGKAAFPGKFQGIDLSGAIVALQSFGFMDITIRDEQGNLLNLLPGRTATVRFPIAEGLKSEAPPTMPLWSFDEGNGLWKEEGTLTRSGDFYEAEVPHFSPWNCDKRLVTCFMRGRVVDCAHRNALVKGARVVAGGPGWESGEDATNEEGVFYFPVAADTDMEFWASKNGTESEHKKIHSCLANREIQVGDICLQTPKMKIVLTWSDRPTDLDAHLTFPVRDSANRGHVYFGAPKADAVTLDTDDTNGHGPEIMTVYDLVDGTYRYSIHHFDGLGNITESGAVLSLLVEGIGLFTLKPPANATNAHDLWHAWDIQVSDGKVTNVSNPNDVLNTLEFSRAEHFNP